MKQSLKWTVPLVFMAVGATVLAQETVSPPHSPFSFSLGVVSDYRVRGISQSAYKSALQGSIDYAHESGLYVGAFGSNVRWIKDLNGATKGDMELDLYGGYRGQITENLSYDLGAIAYRYPGNNSGAPGTPGAGLFSNANTFEVYGALTYKMVTLKYNRSTGNFLGILDSSGSQYFDLSASFDLGNGFTLTPHVGRQLIPNQSLPVNYNDYSLTLTKDFGQGISLSVMGVGTSADRSFYTDTRGRFLGKSGLVFGVKYTF